VVNKKALLVNERSRKKVLLIPALSGADKLLPY